MHGHNKHYCYYIIYIQLSLIQCTKIAAFHYQLLCLCSLCVARWLADLMAAGPVALCTNTSYYNTVQCRTWNTRRNPWWAICCLTCCCCGGYQYEPMTSSLCDSRRGDRREQVYRVETQVFIHAIVAVVIVISDKRGHF